MEQKRYIVKKKRKRRIWRKLLLLIILLVLVVGGYGAYVVYQALQAANTSYTQLDRGNKSALREKTVHFGKEPVSILLLGIEDYATDGKGGRADTIMVATFNPDTKKMKLLSIPRDTKVYIPSKQREGKINGSFNKGKDSAIQTIEEFLDIPIDYYATINFKGFKSVINEIGGVDVDVPFDFWEYNDTFPRKTINFKKGPAHLNGEEALAYARMRKRDPNGDFGRNDRQKEIVKAAFDSMFQPKNLLKVDEISEHVGKNMETNLKAGDGLSFVTKFKKLSSKDIETLKLEGSNDMSTGTYYFLPDQSSLDNIKKTLQEQLDYKSN
ncbi:LCP family protein [Bacillus sp. 1P06AnD]|uniref:LCP family protein n=1 Tax=Bacillus sp. 1P06AnD TaxID=3132208 RepID=UPI0039A29C85